MNRCSSAAEFVSDRVRQRQSSSAAEFGLKNQRTKKRMEVRRRLLRQVRSDVSGTNVTRRFLVPRAGRAGVVVSPLPEEMLCRSRCIVEHNTERGGQLQCRSRPTQKHVRRGLRLGVFSSHPLQGGQSSTLLDPVPTLGGGPLTLRGGSLLA